MGKVIVFALYCAKTDMVLLYYYYYYYFFFIFIFFFLHKSNYPIEIGKWKNKSMSL